LTAFATASTPSSRALRASVAYFSSFVSHLVQFSLGLDASEDVRLAQDEQLLAVDLDLGPAVLAVEDLVALLDVERNPLAVVVELAVADSNDLALLWLLLRGVGRTRPLAVVSSSSIARTISRSPRGLSFIFRNLR
jgi:hypothetical protein